MTGALLRPLTPRQASVVKLAAQGLGTTEIAKELGISYSTAKMHVDNIAGLIYNPDGLTPLRLVRRWAIRHRV